MRGSWSQEFHPAERSWTMFMVSVTDTMEWIFLSLAGLLAIFLFMLAGNKQRQGDTAGACLTMIGATVVVTAPIVAKHFKFY